MTLLLPVYTDVCVTYSQDRVCSHTRTVTGATFTGRQKFPQTWDMTHMPLKKDWVLFTVIFIRITIQMFHRLTLHRRRNQSEFEEVSWRLHVCMWETTECVAALAEEVLKSNGSLLFPFSLSPQFPSSVTLSSLSRNLGRQNKNIIHECNTRTNKPEEKWLRLRSFIPFWSRSC